MFDLELIQRRAKNAVKRKWMQRALRDISDNDNFAGLERVYRITDPWSLDSPLEHARFEATNQEIESRFGKVGSILEIGAGEGFQSAYLQQLCNSLHGVEVSPTAVNRARARIPDAQFHVGDLAQQPWINDGKKFDLVVACEVLYYVADVKTTLRLMNNIGNACFVSFYAPEAHKLSDAIDAIPGSQKSWVTRQRNTWLFAWWKNASPRLHPHHAAKAAFVWLVGCLEYLSEFAMMNNYFAWCVETVVMI